MTTDAAGPREQAIRELERLLLERERTDDTPDFRGASFRDRALEKATRALAKASRA